MSESMYCNFRMGERGRLTQCETGQWEGGGGGGRMGQVVVGGGGGGRESVMQCDQGSVDV